MRRLPVLGAGTVHGALDRAVEGGGGERGEEELFPRLSADQPPQEDDHGADGERFPEKGDPAEEPRQRGRADRLEKY